MNETLKSLPVNRQRGVAVIRSRVVNGCDVLRTRESGHGWLVADVMYAGSRTVLVTRGARVWNSLLEREHEIQALRERWLDARRRMTGRATWLHTELRKLRGQPAVVLVTMPAPRTEALREGPAGCRRVADGWAQADCVHCDGSGYVGFGNEAEACECFIDSSNYTRDEDHCPLRDGGQS